MGSAKEFFGISRNTDEKIKVNSFSEAQRNPQEMHVDKEKPTSMNLNARDWRLKRNHNDID